MKIKNILLGVLFGLVGFGAVYATLAPNIAGWPTITTANPNTYFTIIQSGTTQGKISMSDFANSISGTLGLSGYVPYSGAVTSLNMGTNGIYLNNIGFPSIGLIFYHPSSGRTAKIKGISEGSFYFANSNTGVVLDVNLLTQNRVIKFPDAAGTILLDTTLPAETDPIFLSQSGDYYTNNPLGYITGAALSGYLTGFTESDPVFMSYLATGFTYPGSDSYVPTTKAVADYIEAMALNLGDVITTGGFYISGASTARRTIETGSRYRIEYATGLLGPWKTAGMLDNGGTHNTTFGVGAGRDITAGIFNTFIGHEAGRFNTDGNRNTAIGGYAMRDLTNGTDNTCMGIYCMQNMETGKYNTSMGDESLWSNKTGDNNVAIGMGAGEYAMGSNNVFIGRFADITGYTYLNNSIALGDRALVWTSAMMQIGSTGLNFISTRAKLGIGVQFPTNALSVSGSIDIPATEWMYFGTGRRIGTSGSNLSVQAYTGGNRVEKSVFIP